MARRLQLMDLAGVAPSFFLSPHANTPSRPRALRPPLQNKRDTNGSQFFITLDRADHCNRQYTIFGKVTGEPWG